MAKSAFKSNKDEIKYNIINSLLAGALVFLGAFTTSGFKISAESLALAIATASIIALTKFKDYWATQEGEYKNSTTKLFHFIG